MRTVIEEKTLYKFNELSKEGKEKVKEWYLNKDCRADIFTDMVNEELKELFPNSDLQVQYSFCSCQGDGFNIYGKLNVLDIFNCLDTGKAGELKQYENVINEKEKKTILNYAKECTDIDLPMNNRYCYCMKDYIDIGNEWYFQLENYSNYSNINIEVLDKLEDLVKDIFIELCESYENQGYDYFYNVSEEELEEFCNCNGYEFLKDGTLY